MSFSFSPVGQTGMYSLKVKLVIFWMFLWTAGGLSTNSGDVTESCEVFVENTLSHCKCVIDRSKTESKEKCGNPAYGVTLSFCPGRACFHCTFSDYVRGIIAQKNYYISECKLYAAVDNLYEIRVGILAKMALHDGAEFRCQAECQKGLLVTKTVDIPVGFSPDCAPGKHGQRCDMTCDPACANTTCDRQTGKCNESETDEQPEEINVSNNVSISSNLSSNTNLSSDTNLSSNTNLNSDTNLSNSTNMSNSSNLSNNTTPSGSSTDLNNIDHNGTTVKVTPGE